MRGLPKRLLLLTTIGTLMGCAGPTEPAADDRGPSRSYKVVQHAALTNEEQLFTGQNLAHPEVVTLRRLVEEIFEAYGGPRSDLDRARVLRDWVARVAIHPFPPFHPSGSQRNTAVLPAGVTWRDVNVTAGRKVEEDSRYWASMHFDGYTMLDRLLGTLDPRTGVRAQDGMMERVGVAHYRIRDIATYRYVLCTYQDVMLIRLWEAAGLHGLLLSTIGHDPAAVFIADLGKWVYMDPTYNEEFTLDGSGAPLSPVELLEIATRGEHDRLVSGKISGPRWSQDVWINTADHARATYHGDDHPDGMTVMGSQINNLYTRDGTFRTRLVQIDVPQLQFEEPFNDPIRYQPVSATVAFPAIGVSVRRLSERDGYLNISLLSNYPFSVRLLRRIDGGVWKSIAVFRDQPPTVLDRVLIGASRITYRAVDRRGTHGTDAIIDLTLEAP